MSAKLTTGVWRAWFVWVTAGEFTGFLAPAITGALTSSGPLLVLAGGIEGAVLGVAQSLALRRIIPRLSSRDWIAVTVLGAVFAWSVAMLAVHYGQPLGTLPLAVLLPLAAVAGMGVLLAIGVGQWFVLRRHADHAFRWVWATGIGWCAGMVVFTAFTTPLWQPGEPTALVLLVGAAGGLLMAATAAAITGAALAHLLGRP